MPARRGERDRCGRGPRLFSATTGVEKCEKYAYRNSIATEFSEFVLFGESVPSASKLLRRVKCTRRREGMRRWEHRLGESWQCKLSAENEFDVMREGKISRRIER